MYVSADFNNVFLKLIHPDYKAEIHSKMVIGENLSQPENDGKFLVDSRTTEIEFSITGEKESPRARMIMMTFSKNNDSDFSFTHSDIKARLVGDDIVEGMSLRQALYAAKISYAYGDRISQIYELATKSAQSYSVILKDGELMIFAAPSNNGTYEVISFDLNLK